MNIEVRGEADPKPANDSVVVPRKNYISHIFLLSTLNLKADWLAIWTYCPFMHEETHLFRSSGILVSSKLVPHIDVPEFWEKEKYRTDV